MINLCSSQLPTFPLNSGAYKKPKKNVHHTFETIPDCRMMQSRCPSIVSCTNVLWRPMPVRSVASGRGRGAVSFREVIYGKRPDNMRPPDDGRSGPTPPLLENTCMQPRSWTGAKHPGPSGDLAGSSDVGATRKSGCLDCYYRRARKRSAETL